MESNLICISNLQPITNESEDPAQDQEFLSKIHDRGKLKTLSEEQHSYRLTNQQNNELNLMQHCSLLESPEDFVWGTIDGKVECRCVNTECHRFSRCRSDLNHDQKRQLKQQNRARLQEYQQLDEELRINIKKPVPDQYLYKAPVGEGGFYHPLPIQHENLLAHMSLQVEPAPSEPGILPEEGTPVATKAVVENPTTTEKSFEDWLHTEFLDGLDEAAITAFPERYQEILERGLTNTADFHALTHDAIDRLLENIRQDKEFRREHKDELKDLITELIGLKIHGTVLPETAAAVAVEERKEEPEPQGEEIEEELETPDLEEMEAAQSGPKDFSSFRKCAQKTIIEAPMDRETIVNAGPGTGKTWTLIEKILYMINDLGTDPDQILVLCFSRAAVEVIRDRLKQEAEKNHIGLEWTRLEVRTFDSFATFLIALIMEQQKADENGDFSNILPKNYDLENEGYDDRIQTAIYILQKHSNAFDLDYSHIIVDEVQDLVGLRADLVLALLEDRPENCGFTLLGDSCQAIYDYIADAPGSNETSSVKFYQELFQRYPGADYWTLTKNHRQNQAFDNKMEGYRRAILTGTPEDRRSEYDQLLHSVTKDFGKDALKLTAQDLQEAETAGSVGILTRTNGQALLIANHLQQIGVPYHLMRSTYDRYLDSWIADIFQDYPNDSISEDEFAALFKTRFPEANPTPYWKAMTSALLTEVSHHVRIEDLLEGILLNGKDPLLYAPVMKPEQQIIVSTVHRAKGREFDSVILVTGQELNDYTEENELLENKICYVAMTRPRHAMYLADNDKSKYVCRLQPVGRCMTKKTMRSGKKFIDRLEILGSDINQVSLAEDAAHQEFVRTTLTSGYSLHLHRSQKENQYAPYILLDGDTATRRIGKMNNWFYKVVTMALHKCFNNDCNNRSPIKWERYYPHDFSELLVDRQITCIQNTDVREIPGARRYGHYYIWTGISLTGFPKTTKNRMG